MSNSDSNGYSAEKRGRVRIGATRVNASSFIGAQDVIKDFVMRRQPAYVCPANAFSVMLAVDDPDYRALVNGAGFVTADGMPIVWTQRLLGYPNAERVHNDDLFLACCARFPNWKHYLVGGRIGQPEKVAEEMRARFPGIHVVGTYPTPSRPVSPQETDTIVAQINASQADIVWVGMGTPAQDQWMLEASGSIQAPLVGVGSLFDLLAGHTRPAPIWMKNCGLQWLFRLIQEPRRLAGRYLHYNTRFALLVARQLLAAKLQR